MIFLYVGMGMAMMASIFGMIEFSNSINYSSIDSGIPIDKYIDSQARNMDEILLKKLTQADESWGLGEEFCMTLKSEVSKGSKFFKDLITPYEVSEENYSSKKLSKPCVLSNKSHRVIISTDPTNKILNNNYPNYFSCMLQEKDGFYCKFEEK